MACFYVYNLHKNSSCAVVPYCPPSANRPLFTIVDKRNMNKELQNGTAHSHISNYAVAKGCLGSVRCVQGKIMLTCVPAKTKTKEFVLVSPILFVFQLSRTVCGHMFGNVIVMLSQIIQSSYLLTICKLFSYSDL